MMMHLGEVTSYSENQRISHIAKRLHGAFANILQGDSL